MRYLVLSHSSKFQTNLTTFGGVKSKKPPKTDRNYIFYFLLVRKDLQIENSGTTSHLLDICT